MTNIWILTNSFPYEPGEQFLETEIEYWSRLCDAEVTLLPRRAVGIPRDIPANITVDCCLAASSKAVRRYNLPKALFSIFFIHEILWLRRNGRLSARTARTAWRDSAFVLHRYQLLRQKSKDLKGPLICYSYWFDLSAYATALLRRKGLVDRLVTRAHGVDVYEERHKDDYLPLKRQFAQDFDTVFAISEEGRSYLQTRYAIPTECLKMARLGVAVGNSVSFPSPHGSLNILSVSFCEPVKRIDRMIDALSLAATMLGETVSIHWTHIGGGTLKTELEEKASHSFAELDNIDFQFLGHMPNSEVLQYLKTHKLDLFINTSESEGVPVSIMEAMSHGIPAIAPAVGGIPEMVNRENGWLLSRNPTRKEIAEAICAYKHYKHELTRKAARQKILLDYDAEKNYSAIVHTISQVDGCKGDG